MKWTLGILCLLAAFPGSATTIFAINYTGVLRSGSVRDIDNTQAPISIDLDPGTAVSGTMIFNLDLAPAPTVTVNSGQTQTLFQDSNPAVTWVGGSFSMQLPVLPANGLPIPPFTLTRSFRPPNGQDQFAPAASQTLSFSYGTNSISTVLATAQYQDSWLVPGVENATKTEFVGLLISSLDNWLPKSPGVPTSFTATNLQGGSSFSFLGFDEDLTQLVPPLFGITQNYVVSGQFDVTSATGELSTPEPGTWIAGLALAAPLLARARRIFLCRARTDTLAECRRRGTSSDLTN
jgi:hypothetical protein